MQGTHCLEPQGHMLDNRSKNPCPGANAGTYSKQTKDINRHSTGDAGNPYAKNQRSGFLGGSCNLKQGGREGLTEKEILE